MSASASTPPEAAATIVDSSRVGDLMSHGVVMCDADVSARDVARTMRDRGVPAVFVVDLTSEVIGVVDERALLSGWDEPDVSTAAALMDLDPLVIDPDESVAEAGRRILDAGATMAVVAAPAPPEVSGRWSAWKERGMPVGTLSVADILARLDYLETVVLARPASARESAARRARPWLVLASVVLLVVFLSLVVFLYASGTHHLTNKPGL